MSEAAPTPRRPGISLRSLTLAYGAVLLLVVLGLEWRAESWLPLALLAFAPAPILLSPLAVLLPLSLWRRQGRLVLLQLACAVLIFYFYMGFRWHFGSPKEGDRDFVAITHNIGQGNRQAFVDSFPDAHPDAVLLQDVQSAGRQQAAYLKRYPTFRAVPVDPQFVLLTPHPVESATAVREALWHGRPVAARFVLDVHGEKIALYSVHLPTPRHSLAHVFTPRVLLEILWMGKAPTDGFDSYREWLDARVTLAHQLAAVLAAERLPFLVGGDFNMPDHGIVYHTFAGHWSDAHVATGSAWGFTFPGTREGGVAAMLGCWLRLDYWFSGPGWKPAACVTADDDHSQHRAVLARFSRLP